MVETFRNELEFYDFYRDWSTLPGPRPLGNAFAFGGLVWLNPFAVS